MSRRTNQTAQTTQPQVEGMLEGESLEEFVARLQKEQAELLAALETEKAKHRRTRTGPTPKQRKLIAYLDANPDADIATACVEAGATATSHGFLWRLVEDGYLAVSITDAGRSYLPAEGESVEDDGDVREDGSEPSAESEDATESETADAA